MIQGLLGPRQASPIRTGLARPAFSSKRGRRRGGDRVSRRGRDHALRLREAITRAKARPCADCGNYYVHDFGDRMTFDHLPGHEKRFDIGAAGVNDAGELGHRLVSLEDLAAEIAKCEVVCWGCHQVRTRARQVLAKALAQVFEVLRDVTPAKSLARLTAAPAPAVQPGAPSKGDRKRAANLEDFERHMTSACRELALRAGAVFAPLAALHRALAGSALRQKESAMSERTEAILGEIRDTLGEFSSSFEASFSRPKPGDEGMSLYEAAGIGRNIYVAKAGLADLFDALVLGHTKTCAKKRGLHDEEGCCDPFEGVDQGDLVLLASDILAPLSRRNDRIGRDATRLLERVVGEIASFWREE